MFLHKMLGIAFIPLIFAWLMIRFHVEVVWAVTLTGVVGTASVVLMCVADKRLRREEGQIVCDEDAAD